MDSLDDEPVEDDDEEEEEEITEIKCPVTLREPRYCWEDFTIIYTHITQCSDMDFILDNHHQTPSIDSLEEPQEDIEVVVVLEEPQDDIEVVDIIEEPKEDIQEADIVEEPQDDIEVVDIVEDIIGVDAVEESQDDIEVIDILEESEDIIEEQNADLPSEEAEAVDFPDIELIIDDFDMDDPKDGVEELSNQIIIENVEAKEEVVTSPDTLNVEDLVDLEDQTETKAISQNEKVPSKFYEGVLIKLAKKVFGNKK